MSAPVFGDSGMQVELAAAIVREALDDAGLAVSQDEALRWLAVLQGYARAGAIVSAATQAIPDATVNVAQRR